MAASSTRSSSSSTPAATATNPTRADGPSPTSDLSAEAHQREGGSEPQKARKR